MWCLLLAWSNLRTTSYFWWAGDTQCKCVCCLCSLCIKTIFLCKAFRIAKLIFFQVSIELTTVNRDLSSNKSQTKLASGVTFSPRRETNKTTQRDDIGRGDDWSPGIPVKEPSSQPDLHASADTSRHQVEEESEILLHALLMVPDGRNFSCGSMKAPSLYLNCKLFWSDAIARSIVSWSQANPSFHFVQVGTESVLNKSNSFIPMFSSRWTHKMCHFASGDSCGFNK